LHARACKYFFISKFIRRKTFEGKKLKITKERKHMALEIKRIPIANIVITKDNPRQAFNEESLRRLGESIRSHGLMQPIIVRPKESYYELVVGERRLRAAQLIGLTEIEARIQDIDDATSMELRLIENTHREDLTDAEKGNAVYALIENYPKKYETVKDVAREVNTPYATVSSWCRASEKLSPKVKQLIHMDRLDDSKARYLLKYDHSTQNRLAETIVEHGLTWRQIVDFIKQYDDDPAVNLDDLADEFMGTKKVEISVEKLTPEARREVEEIIEEKRELAEKARKKAIKKAQEAPRRKPRRIKPKAEVPRVSGVPAREVTVAPTIEASRTEVEKMPERPETKGVVLTALVPTELFSKVTGLAAERQTTLAETVVYIIEQFFNQRE
jgi:ParB family chromosome partitioning protein